MFIKFVDIDCFLCNSYPCVLFESLSRVINQESHVYSWNLGKTYLLHMWLQVQVNVPFLYPLKLENRKFSVFRDYRKDTLTWNGLNVP